MNKYTLLSDGDDFEKHFYNIFLNNEFLSYEKFWIKFVVPLTNRPVNIHTKDDKELKKINKGQKEVCIAQLHYTVFIYLSKAYMLKQIKPLNPDQFAEGLIKICSALDVADELLERYTSSKKYNPWSWKDSKKARDNWRSSNNQLQSIRNYRNRMIHGAIVPAIIIYGTYSRYRMPKYSKINSYVDWRKVTNSSIGKGGKVRNDFDAPNNLIDQAWDKTLKYLEDNWKKHLL